MAETLGILTGDLCNQTTTLLNTAEIAGNNNRFKLSPLQWSKFKRQLSSSILHELSISSHKNKKLNLNISVEIKLSYLNGLSRYQEELIRNIEELRGKSWMFKDISDFLKSKNFKSSRGKEISPQLVERMYKKYLKKIERENYIEISMDKT